MTIKLRSPLTGSVAVAAIVASVGWIADVSSVSASDKQQLSDSFSFETLAFPESKTGPKHSVVRTHPDLAHLSAWVSAVGSSVAFGDLDEDGLDNDMCFTDPRTKEALIATAPGTDKRFELFALEIGEHFDRDISFPTGCLVGDYNEDGLDDLLVYFFGRTPLLAMRRTEGGKPAAMGPDAYTVSELLKGDTSLWYTAAATQADVDGDGHVDLVFGNYFLDDARMYDSEATGSIELQDSFSHALNAGTNRLYLWRGADRGNSPRARFEEAPEAFTQEEARAWTLALGAADLNDDGLPELYFANDYGPDRLFLNQSTNGAVKLMRLEGERGIAKPKSKVIGRDSFKGMGVDFADINSDGRFDMFVSNIAEEWALQESHFLWLSTEAPLSVMQDGQAPYEDLGEELGVAHSYWGWDTRFGDFNNDGVSELLQATGFVKGTVNRWPELAEFAIGNDVLVHHPKSWPHIMPGDDVSGHVANPFYARLGDGRYAEIGAELGIDAPYVTRGIATSDVDGDGDLDIAYANQWEPSVLLKNKQQSGNSFLGLHILAPTHGASARPTSVVAGHPSSADQGYPAVGATVRFELAEGQKRLAQVDGCSGHAGCSSKTVHFGLAATPADTRILVMVRWRSAAGTRQETVTVTPGWHTILLGGAASNEVNK